MFMNYACSVKFDGKSTNYVCLVKFDGKNTNYVCLLKFNVKSTNFACLVKFDGKITNYACLVMFLTNLFLYSPEKDPKIFPRARLPVYKSALYSNFHLFRKSYRYKNIFKISKIVQRIFS